MTEGISFTEGRIYGQPMGNLWATYGQQRSSKGVNYV